MTEPKSLFDIIVTCDLPAEVTSQLRYSVGQSYSDRIVELLRMADRPLHVNEIMVGYYRKFGEIKKFQSLYTRLMRLVRDGGAISGGNYTFSLPS